MKNKKINENKRNYKDIKEKFDDLKMGIDNSIDPLILLISTILKNAISNKENNEDLLSTRAFNHMIKVFDEMKENHGDIKELKEFRIYRLEKERDNFVSLINKEINKIKNDKNNN